MRLIDADALKETICTNVYPVADGFNSRDYGMFWTGGIEKAIDEAPTVDAVPVVRCKDCKYYEETDETIGTCLLTESGAHIKGYCSWAEVKEE